MSKNDEVNSFLLQETDEKFSYDEILGMLFKMFPQENKEKEETLL